MIINNVFLYRSIIENYKYKFIYGFDFEFIDFFSYFEECFYFIEDVIESGGSVFVYCFMGCFRSVIIAIVYFMYKNKIIYEEVLEIVKNKRLMVCFNEGFIF